ncbi:MAG TPA: DUF6798 domain-containing protein [Bryobacteraceae bacterium]|nr:DUF6798 domain-containing protein [Bryobacteraceae bacterium]
MRQLWIGAAILGMTLLNFFQFPGHTWLQQDSQIYAPILEHMWDPAALQKDIVARHPHVAFTLYDEVAVALRRVTGLDFQHVLQAEQFLTRALGIWGVYLIAAALGLSDLLALLTASVFALDAYIVGPAVLVFEYEPTPRAFAVPLLFLAMGLAARERFLGAAIAASVAFLMHPPTAVPFWIVYLALVFWPPERRKRAALWVIVAAVVVLYAASRSQSASGQAQTLFSTVGPHQEELQRLRASYNWVSTWWQQYLVHYLMLYAATVIASWRLWKNTPRALRFFFLGLPLIGMVSVPVSYLLLERLHWALIPEFQPTRALLFVTAVAMLLGAAAACHAVAKKRYVEAVAWLALAFLPPTNTVIEWPSWNRVGVVLVLALLTVAAIRALQLSARWGRLAALAAILTPLFLIPNWGKVENYPALHTPELEQLSRWARTSTPRDAVFLFADAGRDLAPGIFRGEAVRAIYVDWKSGGQVNFFKDLGEEWWSRWQQTLAQPFDPRDVARYRALGIDYIVVNPKNRLPAATPTFEDARYVVYKL